MRISDWSSDVCSSDLCAEQRVSRFIESEASSPLPQYFKTGAEMAFRIISERGYLRHSLYFYDTPRSSHRYVENEDFVRFLSVPMMPVRYRAGPGADDGGTVDKVEIGNAWCWERGWQNG